MIKEKTETKHTENLKMVDNLPKEFHILKNNKLLLETILLSNPNDIEVLKDIILTKKFKEKISNIFNYYKLRGVEDINSIKNRKICNLIPVTGVVENLIARCSENFDINLDQTFELIDEFFQLNMEKLNNLIKKEEYVNFISQNPEGTVHLTKISFYELNHKFQNLIKDIEIEISDFYLSQRVYLMKFFNIFISRCFNPNYILNSEFLEVFNSVNKENSLANNLWEQFKKYRGDFRIIRHFEDATCKEKHNTQFLKEQNLILESMILLALKNESSFSFYTKILGEILETFSNNKFMGYYYEIINLYHNQDNRQLQNKISLDIMDQSEMFVLLLLNIKYVNDYINEKDTLGQEVKFDPNKMPFLIFKNKEIWGKFLKFLQENQTHSFSAPIFMTIYSVFKLLKFEIENKLIDDNDLINNIGNLTTNDTSQEKNILEFYEKNNNFNVASGIELLNQILSRVLFNNERINTDNHLKFITKNWIDLTLKFYFEYSFNADLIELVTRCLNSEGIREMFWSFDTTYESPMKELFEKLLENFPNNLDYILQFCNSVKGREGLKNYSSKLYEKLSCMKHFNVEGSEYEINNLYEKYSGEIVILKEEKPTLWGLKIPKGTQGKIIDKSNLTMKEPQFHGYIGKKFHVRFDLDFSIFDLLFHRWNYLIEILIKKDKISEIMDYLEERNIIDFISLFCSLISGKTQNIHSFLESKYIGEENIENDQSYNINEQKISDRNNNLKQLISKSFETINLSLKNWQLYSGLYPLSNSIYKMLQKLLYDESITKDFINILNQNFLESFESSVKINKLKQFGNGHQFYQPSQYSPFTGSTSPNIMNLTEIFSRTMIYDLQNRSFGNSIIILKIIRKLFMFPNILNLNRPSSLEFLYNLWRGPIIEYIKNLFFLESFNSSEEFYLCNQILKIISNMFSIISVSNINKVTIITYDPNGSISNYYDLIVACLNSVETAELILKVLKVRVIKEHGKMFMKDNPILKNSLYDNIIEKEKIPPSHGLAVKSMIRNAFKCLNLIFDTVITLRMTNDENIRKIYYKINTIKIWYENFFLTKTIYHYDSRSIDNQCYSINLVLSVFSYCNFEYTENFEYITPKYKYNILKYEDQEKYFKLGSDENILNIEKQDHISKNVCSLSLTCMNRLLILLKLQGQSQIEKNNLKNIKIQNLSNFLILKKETSIELENSINLFNIFKEFLIRSLTFRFSDLSFKLEIIKFLTNCADSQNTFLSLFLEDFKFKNFKFKNFWQIFDIMIKNPNPPSDVHSHFPNDEYLEQYKNLMGHLVLFISKIFSSEVYYKKQIKDLLSTYKSEFDYFLKISCDMYSLKNREEKLRKPRDFFNNKIAKEYSFVGIFLLEEQENYTISCFEYIVNKSLSIIFAKLIIFSEVTQSILPEKKFTHYKELIYFLNENFSNFLEEYNTKLNYESINYLNIRLTEESSFLFPYEENNQNFKNSIKKAQSQGITRNYNFKENLINLKNIEKVIPHNLENYHLPFTIDSENSVFKYSINYWIDIKELFILLISRNYNTKEIFNNYFLLLVEHNLELGLFESKVQTMFSMSYLLGLIFSVGFNDAFMSTYLFTDPKVNNIINSSTQMREFSEQFLKQINMSNGHPYPKLNFNLLSPMCMTQKEFFKFSDEKILRQLKLDLDYYTSNGKMDNKREQEILIEERPYTRFNFYNQYISLKYNILNYLVDYTIYLNDNKEVVSKSSLGINVNITDKKTEFPHGVFQQDLMPTLRTIEKDLPKYINNFRVIDMDKCLLSMINVFFSIINYLISSEYIFNKNDIITINSIIKSLLVIYDNIPSYQAIVIFILNAYLNLNYFLDEDEDSNQNISHKKDMSLNIIINSSDNSIIKKLMKKLSQNLSEQEYLAIITLIITLVDNYQESLDIILSEKILLTFQLNDKFNNVLMLPEYQDNERGVDHILWCWTLILLRQICLKVSSLEDGIKYSPILISVVEFVSNHESRFLRILSDTDYVDQGGNHLQKSLAYLEEMEYITGLLNALFLQSKKWKTSSPNNLEFHNRFVNLILSKSFKLFIGNVKISNHFKCISNIEKSMNEISPSEKSDIIHSVADRHMYTSFYSPQKKRREPGMGIVQNISLSPQKDTSGHRSPLSAYCPNLFYFRVDQCLSKILFNLSNIVKCATMNEPFSNPQCFVNYLKDTYSRGGVNSGNLKIFDQLCQSLIYALYYSIHSLESMTKNKTSIKMFYDISVIFFENISASLKFGNLNLKYIEGIIII
jgi:hypothetical protein